jgi:thiamine kinase-like enzyme
MSNIYVKLKEEVEINGKMEKITQAKDILGTLIYPGSNKWRIFKENQLEKIKQHRDYNLLEIKTQEDIDNENEKYKQEINDIICEPFMKLKKTITETTDRQKLKDIIKRATELSRNKVVQLASERLEELSI